MCKIMIQTRQILGGLMRLFQHQLNHTEFLTKTAQPKPTFWKSIILESNHPTCWMVTGSHYCGSLVKIFQESLKIFEDLYEDPSADLWGSLSKILKDIQRSCLYSKILKVLEKIFEYPWWSLHVSSRSLKRSLQNLQRSWQDPWRSLRF